MRRGASIVGLDCSGRVLRAIRMTKRRDGFRLRATASMRRTVCDGPPAVDDLARLHASMVRSGVGAHGIVATAPRELVSMASTDVAAATDDADIRHTAERELARLLDVPSNALELAWAAMPARRGAGQEISITGCTHAVVEEFLATCTEAGLDIVSLKPDTFALAHLVAGGGNDGDPEVAIRAAVAIEWHRFTVVVVANGRPVFERVIPGCGLAPLAAAIGRHLGADARDDQDADDRHRAQDREVIEHLLFGAGLAPDRAHTAELRRALAEPADSMVDELDRTVRYVAGRYRSRALRAVRVVGEGALVPGLTEHIVGRLGLGDALRGGDETDPFAVARTLVECAA